MMFSQTFVSQDDEIGCPSLISIRSDHRSTEYAPPEADTSRRRGVINRFNSFIAPVVLLGSLFAPADQIAVECLRTRSRTSTTRLVWADNIEHESPWAYRPELVTPDQVRALDELFGLPTVPELDLFLDRE